MSDLLPPKTYLLPFSKFFISTQSLEICTESLGTETGNAVDASPYLADNGGQQLPEKAMKKVKRRSFPRPLSSIVHFQTHREGGRLVMKAFTVSSFQAERGDGRLRLCLQMHCEDEEEEHILWSRCNGDISRMQSCPFCVAIS